MRIFLPIVFSFLTFACATSRNLDSEGNPIPLYSYYVDGDRILNDSIADEDLALWTRFTELIPTAYRPEIKVFQIIDGEIGRDGVIDGAIYAQNPEIKDVWVLQLDGFGAAAPDDLDRTMVHEFAHLLTLRASQVPVFKNEESEEELKAACKTFFVAGEGCSTKNSYLNRFVEDFWKDFLPVQSDARATAERYENYPDQFVTDYAATSPEEDIAESFATYTLTEVMPEQDTIAHKKVLFFESYPEISKLKADIRASAGF